MASRPMARNPGYNITRICALSQDSALCDNELTYHPVDD